jgi:energy-coupling factor transporter transmembrane protein EcfT
VNDTSPPYRLIALAVVVGTAATATLPTPALGWIVLSTLLGLGLTVLLAPDGQVLRVWKRGLLVGPFILFLAAMEFFRPDAGGPVAVLGLDVPSSLVRATGFLLKTIAAVSLGLAWGARVGAHGVARTLHRFGAPAPAVAVTFLTVNYLAIVGREWEGVRLAARARGLNHASYAFRLRQLGSSLMSVLVRSIWRGDRVAMAMQARGYHGRLPRPMAEPARFAPRHALLLGGALALVAVAILARMM